MLSYGTRAAAGLMGAFQSVRGVMTLLGVESENVEKAIMAMQASMGVIQGLQAVASGVKAFKDLATAIKASTLSLNGLKAALVSTGIGAIVVTLGTIIANWEKISSFLGFNNGGQTVSNSPNVPDNYIDPEERTEEEFINKIKEYRKEYKSLLENIDKLEAELKKIKENYATNIIKDDDLRDRMEQLQKDRSLLEREYEIANEKVKAANKLADSKKKEKAYLSKYLEIWEEEYKDLKQADDKYRYLIAGVEGRNATPEQFINREGALKSLILEEEALTYYKKYWKPLKDVGLKIHDARIQLQKLEHDPNLSVPQDLVIDRKRLKDELDSKQNEIDELIDTIDSSNARIDRINKLIEDNIKKIGNRKKNMKI